MAVEKSFFESPVKAPASSRKDSIRLAVIYLAVSFVTAWSFWLLSWLYTKGFIIHLSLTSTLIVGSFGPFVAAAASTCLEGGFRQTLRFFARVFNLRMGWTVLIVSFCLMPVLAMGAELLHSGLAHTPFVFNMTWSDLPMSYVFLFFLGGTLGEEFGWSYLSDKLDLIFPLTRATFVLGAVWAIWHLPLFFIIAPGLSQADTPFYMFFLSVLCLRFLFAWTYHKGGGNIMSNMLFHTSGNLAYSIVAIAPTAGQPGHAKYWYLMIFTLASAALLWTLSPPRSMSVS